MPRYIPKGARASSCGDYYLLAKQIHLREMRVLYGRCSYEIRPDDENTEQRAMWTYTIDEVHNLHLFVRSITCN